MRITLRVVTCLSGSLYVGQAAAQLNDHDVQTIAAIERYRGNLITLKTAPSRRSLYALFDTARDLQRLMMTLDGIGDEAWIERLPEARYAQLDQELEGLILHRGLDIHVEIDRAVFVTLATAHGTPADLAFFERYQGAYNDQALPVFPRFTDRVAPCVAFGEGLLEQQYRTWRDFARDHPAAYPDFTRDWIDTIQDIMVQGTCTADTESVKDNLDTFVRDFPGTPVRAQIEARVTMLEDTPYRRPVHCR